MKDTGGMPCDKISVPVLIYECVCLVCSATKLSDMWS